MVWTFDVLSRALLGKEVETLRHAAWRCSSAPSFCPDFLERPTMYGAACWGVGGSAELILDNERTRPAGTLP